MPKTAGKSRESSRSFLQSSLNAWLVAGRTGVIVHFLDYSLDAANADFRRGKQALALRPKTLAVLEHLVRRAGRLVTKAELLDAVWPETAVGEWVLTGCVQELRRILADDARQPRIIQTVHGHGYRFIAPVRPAGVDERQAGMPPSAAAEPGARLVGRARELDRLDAWLQSAAGGERQIGFIAGEAGIGKTALVDEFLRRLGHGGAGACIARGQCVEQHGAGEPYLPVLEALGRLLADRGEPLVALLRRHAPAWLVQLPGLLEAAELETLERRLGATTRERMLGEMAAFVEALPAPLVLVVEDLHWSDDATLDLITTLARRRAAARLLVLGTYRPVDVVVRELRLKAIHQELRAHRLCGDLWLEPLDQAGVETYLQSRWPGLEPLVPLARLVHEHTDGNPLFLVNVADYLSASGAVVGTGGTWRLETDIDAISVGVPHGLRQMIVLQVDRLGESERAALEAGSLAGRTFSAALVASALDADLVGTEERLARLAENRHMIRAAGESRWPDGTAAGAYTLDHYLYQSVLRERVPPARRRLLHERIATRLEAAYGDRAAEIATELAFHLEAAGRLERALPYNEEGAARALRRGASREALALIDRGLAALDGLPPTPERTLMAIRLCLARGSALSPSLGFGDPEVERSYVRARTLSEASEDLPRLLQALFALGTTYVAQARLDRAAEVTREILARVNEVPFPTFVFAAHMVAGMVAYEAGAPAEARRHLEAADAIEDVPLPALSMDVRLLVGGYLGLTLLHQGQPDAGLARIEQATARALSAGRPFDLNGINQIACVFHLQSRDWARLAERAQDTCALASDNGFRAAEAIGRVCRGRVQSAQGECEPGVALMREGIEAYRASGQLVALPVLLAALAEGYVEAAEIGPALDRIVEARAVAESSGELRYRAELHRVEGEIRLRSGDRAAADACFRRATETAREFGARWWELRATVSWCRMQTGQAGRRAARRALSALVASFTEGSETADVQEALALLARLG